MSSSDETFRMADAWRDYVAVRRGGRTRREYAPDADAEKLVAELNGCSAAAVTQLLAHPASDPELVAAARAYLADAPTPLGAAALTLVQVACMGYQFSHYVSKYLDVLVIRHGVPFAAEAVVRLVRMVFAVDESGRPEALRPWSPEADHDHQWWNRARLIERMRRLLTVASDADYQAAVDVLAQYRDGLWSRMIAAYLVPDQTAWVDELCAEAASVDEWWFTDGRYKPWYFLGDTISTVAQLDISGAARHSWGPHALLTLTDAVGPDIAPFFAGLLDQATGSSRETLLEVLAAIHTDEVFQLLLGKIGQWGVGAVVLATMDRDPVRATVLLARATETDWAATELLVRHVSARPELRTAQLPEDVRGAIDAAMAADDRLRESLPDLLVRPPWTRPRSGKPAPVVIKQLADPVPPRIDWQEGECAKWARSGHYWSSTNDWSVAVEEFTAGRLGSHGCANVLVCGPEELVRPLLADYRPKQPYDAGVWGKAVVARFGLDARPLAVHLAATQPVNGSLLLPFFDAEIANLMADWLVRLKSARKHAAAWLSRHAEAATPLLVAAALDTPGPVRHNAEAALRFLAANGRDVRAVAARHGTQAQAAIDAALAADPAELLPAKIPTPGSWLAELPLSALLLRDRTTRLPGWAVEHIVTMLVISKPDNRYVGLDTVTELCDPRSLAEFGWLLFEGWQAGGLPAKDGWVLTALTWLGNDDTVRRLAPVIRAWPGEGGHARAVAGLDVLAGIGTDLALVHLNNIAQKAKFKGLKSRAQEKIAEVARARDLSPVQLADRLVPDFGLDADGSMLLDYGPRRFVVGFDEQLRPFVADEDGKRRKDLPKPGAKDDPELAPDAYQRFAGLKKDVRTAAGDQVQRLEQAMVAGRRWTTTEFTELFGSHPLLGHLVRRLVWLIDDGHLGFRVAEDRTLADVEDNELVLPENASVGIAHPLHLGEQLTGWADLFANYAILQPFPQLGRPVFTGDEVELDRFTGVSVPTGKALGLQRRGWARAEPEFGGWQTSLSKPLSANRTAVLHLNPGFLIGVPDVHDEQKLETIMLREGTARGWRPVTIDTLDPVTASELLADLTDLTTS